MMRTEMIPQALLVLAAASLLACGDNESGSSLGGDADAADTTDGSASPTDADGDGGALDGDTGPDPDAGDAAPDGDADGPNPDADPDADPDTDPGPDCEPVPTCQTTDECATDSICSFDECLSPTTPAEVTYDGALFRVTALRFGAPGTFVALDVDGDGVPENALGAQVIAFPRAQEVAEREINRALLGGLLTLVPELQLEPSQCGADPGTSRAVVIIHQGTADLDGDGFVDELTAGETRQVAFAPDSFTPDFGPRCQLRRGSLDDETGLITARGGEGCELTLPLPSGEILVAPVDRLVVQVRDPSLPSTKDGELDPATVAGSIQLQAIVDEANRLAPSCACAGIDPSLPLAALEVESGFANATCLQSPSSEGCAEQQDGQVCSNLEELCLSMVLLSSAADLSSEPEGPVDSVSFGFEATLEVVEVADEPLVPDLVARGDHWRVNVNLDLDPGRTSSSLAVLTNDELLADEGDTLLSVAFDGEPPTGFTAEVAGSFINIGVGDTFDYGEDAATEVSFSYTIGSAEDESRRSTALVTLRLAAQTPAVETTDDEMAATLPGEAATFDVLANDLVASYAIGYVSAFTQPDNGTVSFGDRQRTLLFVPTRRGESTFTYTARSWSELGGDSTETTATVTVVVSCAAGAFGELCTPCTDCDVCEATGTVCGPGSSCLVDTDECLCQTGFAPNGEDGCTDIDECTTLDPCGESACTNTPGGYECACSAGSLWDGSVGDCVAPNPCLDGTAACDSTERCIADEEVEGGYDCVPRGAWVEVHVDEHAAFMEFQVPSLSMADDHVVSAGYDITEATTVRQSRRGPDGWVSRTPEGLAGRRASFSPDGSRFFTDENGLITMYQSLDGVFTPLDSRDLGGEREDGATFNSYDRTLVVTDAYVYLVGTVFDSPTPLFIVQLPWTPDTLAAPVEYPISLSDFSFGAVVDATRDGLLAFGVPQSADNGQVQLLIEGDGGALDSDTLDPEAGDGFGASFGYDVALSGDGAWLLVSSPFFGISSECSTCGAMDLFRNDGDTWSPIQRVQPIEGSAVQFYGARLALAPPFAVTAYSTAFRRTTSSQYVVEYWVQGRRSGRLYPLDSRLVDVGDLDLAIRGDLLAEASTQRLTLRRWVYGVSNESPAD